MNHVEEGDHLHKVRKRLKEMIVFLMWKVSLYVQVSHKHKARKSEQLFLPPANFGGYTKFS